MLEYLLCEFWGIGFGSKKECVLSVCDARAAHPEDFH
jgi:hypothetical protein